MTRARSALTVLAAAACSTSLPGQGTCVIETLKPFQLQSAAVYLQRHDANQKNPAERDKNLKQAVQALTDNPGRIKNEAGRNLLLVVAYVRWFSDQGATPTLKAKRGDVGFSENPDGDFVLPQALDEALSAIEREAPACADSTARYRMAFVATLENSAISAYNARSYDAAIESANYALTLKPRGAQAATAYQALANSYHAKNDVANAIASYEKYVAALEPGGAASAPQRAEASYNIAVLTQTQATALQGESRAAGLKKAIEWFNKAVELAPGGPRAATAKVAAAKLMEEITGGAQPVTNLYTDMLANPSKYTALQLFEAGVSFANESKFEDAAKAYETGLQLNPAFRDALFNVASVYRALHQPDKMAPVVERLRAIDPMNPEVLQLAGAVWQERLAVTKDARAKKLAQDSVNAYVEKAARLPARVRVTQFAVSKGTVTLGGSVENRGAAMAAYTLMFEFVDKSGNSVGSTTVIVEKVPPKATVEFSAQASGASPVAWRYTMR
jgi:tetratricopeptide (TPR) repeat protein